MTPLDPAALRLRFPALARTGEDGRPVVYADAPGGLAGPGDGDRRDRRASAERASATRTVRSPASEETDALIAEARRAAADVTGADPDEIVFGPNSTTLLLHLSRSFGRTLRPGDEVVVTTLDHDANVRPWVLAAQDAGATVRWVDVRDDDVTLDIDSFEAALNDRTRAGRVHAWRRTRSARSRRPPSSIRTRPRRRCARRGGRRALRAAPRARPARARMRTSSRARRTSSSARTWAC